MIPIYRSLRTTFRLPGRWCSVRAASYAVSCPVSVEWSGLWWPASVKQIDGEKCKVSFVNWPEKWDEWIGVSSDRVKDPLVQPSSFSLSDPSESSTIRSHATPPPVVDSGSLSRKVVLVEIGGKEYLTSNLTDGRIVFLDPLTGILSWSVPTAESPEAASKPKEPVVESVKAVKTKSSATAKKVKAGKTHVPKAKPLPAGFVERTDLEGTPYYFNTINCKAQYLRPTLSAVRVAKNMKTAQTPTAPWEVYFDADGKPYYSNVDTGTVSWVLPAPTSEKPSSSLPPHHAVDTVVSPAARLRESLSSSESNERTLKSVMVDNVPLPDGWDVHYTDDGFPYYHCQATGESHWELPRADDDAWWVPPSSEEDGKKIRVG